MKNLILLAISLLMSAATPASATVLLGKVEFDPGTGRIGVQVSQGGKVVRVHPQSPAEQCGLLPGDKILSVNGKSGDVSHIHGDIGSTVTLTIMRGGEQLVREVERINEHMIQPYSGGTAQRTDQSSL